MLEGGDVPRAIGLSFDPQLRDHALCRAQGVQAEVGLQRHRQLRVEACFLQGHQLTHLCHEGLGFGLLVLVCTWDQVHGTHLHLRWLRLDLGAWVVLHLQQVHEICRKEEDVLVELSSVIRVLRPSTARSSVAMDGFKVKLTVVWQTRSRRSIPSGRVTRGGRLLVATSKAVGMKSRGTLLSFLLQTGAPSMSQKGLMKSSANE